MPFSPTADSSYDYRNQDLLEIRRADDGSEQLIYDSTGVNIDPNGTEFSVYVGHRLRPLDPLTLEWGLRYDRMTWSDDDLWLWNRG